MCTKKVLLRKLTKLLKEPVLLQLLVEPEVRFTNCP